MDRREVLRIAALARVELAADEVRALQLELGRILDWVAALDELELAAIPKTAGAAAGAHPMREDEPRPGLGAALALAPAAEVEAGHFRVPRVIEG